MASPVLLLDDPTSGPHLDWCRLAGVFAPCQVLPWQSLDPEALQASAFRLIIATIDSGSVDAAAAFLQWLFRNPLPVPVFTVLCGPMDSGFLQTVADVADDFLFWPVREEEVVLRLSKILASRSCVETLEGEMGLANLVGRDPAFVKAIEQVKLFGSSNAPVLITGETGTGKELFAHAIHALGRRKNGPFIPLDCSALSEQLAESELFGHCRGAFTDAYSDRKGLAAMADGGTLFLDEIDSLSAASQAKLLRFLQEGTYRALGTDRFVRANVRVLAASNRDLELCVREGRFRSDLYFRVNVLRLHLPSLRERRGDIPLLANHFLDHHGVGAGEPRKTFSPAALRRLQSHSWPGNVRELGNTVERAAVSCPGRQITPAHISFGFGGPAMAPAESDSDGTFRIAKRFVIERFEQNYVEELLAKHQGNITHAALEARKDRRAFGKLAKKYGLIRSRPA